MVNFCAVFGCSSKHKTGSGISFHRFPDVRKKPALWKKWVRALARQNWTPSHYTYICSQHFEKSSFQVIKPGGRALLHRYASPTIFNNVPAQPQGSNDSKLDNMLVLDSMTFLRNYREVQNVQIPKQAQPFATLDRESPKCPHSALEEEEDDDLQGTASALDDVALWAEQQQDAISALGEEIQNWSRQQQTSASLLETDIEQLSSAQHESTSNLEKELEKWASRHSTPSRRHLNRWTASHLQDVASSLDRDLEKWAKLNRSSASGLEDGELEKWTSMQTDVSSLDRNLQKWMCKRPSAVLNKERVLEKWSVPPSYHDISVSLDRDLEKWEIQQRENAATLERDLEKWVGQCQQSALNRETDLEKWVSLHRKRTSHLEKEIDDWVVQRRSSMHLLEQEADQSHYRRHSSVSLLERELKKHPPQSSPHRGHVVERGGGVSTLPRRNWKRVMQKRTFKETSV